MILARFATVCFLFLFHPPLRIIIVHTLARQRGGGVRPFASRLAPQLPSIAQSVYRDRYLLHNSLRRSPRLRLSLR
eukprot:6214521-Pleurochrysis_carterae.AAC.2